MELPEKLHEWYLEAVKEQHPESYNPKANKPYSELTEEQKFIDKYIAEKITAELIKKMSEVEEKEESIGQIDKIGWLERTLEAHGWNAARHAMLQKAKEVLNE